MRPLLAIIKKEFQAMTRDVHGLLVLFIMPAVFILIMSLALRDTFKLTVVDKVRWQLWDEDHTKASADLVAHLPAPESKVSVRARADLDRALGRGAIQLAVVIEKGFSGAMADEKTHAPLVTLLAEPGTPPALIGGFRAEVARALSMARVSSLLEPMRAAAESAGSPLPAIDRINEETLYELKWHRDTSTELTAVQQSVPAWLVFAMFFVVIPLSTIFIAEKQQGTLPRLRSLRVPMGLLLAGKVVPFYLVNLVQTGLMLLVGRYLVPLLGGDALRLEVDWLALWAMATAVSLAAIGFALAVAALAKTTEQATMIGGVANILFGALGGIMVPKLVMPVAMQSATMLSPMAWGLNGFLDIFVRGAQVGGVLLPIGLLMGFAACCLAIALRCLRKI